VNGEPACANTFLLKDRLRGAWHFSGYVVSDCDAIYDVFNGHHFTRSMAEAGAVAVKAGMDNECADFFTVARDNSDYVKFLDAVQQHLLTENDIDVALNRLFTARFRLGLFDPSQIVPYAQTPESEIDSAPHRALALKIARESIVLLKNDGTLPFNPGVKKIAVFGPLAESTRVLHGNYSGTASHAVTALEGIAQQFGAERVSFHPGMNFLRDPQIIPNSALSTGAGQTGLQAEYFAGDKLEDTPQVTRVDPTVNLQLFNPDPSAVPPPTGMKDFSARWTGFLTPSESGNYQVGLNGSQNQLWLDGKLLVDDPALHDPTPSTKLLPLEKGRRYSLRVEFTRGGFGTKLIWLKVIADPIAAAVAAAKQADVAVAVVGITSQLEGEEMKVEAPGFKGGDRTRLDLPKEEEDLLQALKTAGKPLVVVLMNGSALSVNWAGEHANAILDAWYSGEEGGTAIAQTLDGSNNPAGRLPVTFYKSVDQLPAFEDYSMANRTYRYFTGQPLYPFGYGLSYATFEYSNLKLSTNRLQAGDTLFVDADIKNASPIDGDEVAQAYLTFPRSPATPIHALRAFRRMHIGAGETQHVRFTLDPRDLSEVSEQGAHIVAGGKYKLTVGGGQPGTTAPQQSVQFKIKGKQKLPD
jgi:beta-glucosidase